VYFCTLQIKYTMRPTGELTLTATLVPFDLFGTCTCEGAGLLLHHRPSKFSFCRATHFMVATCEKRALALESISQIGNEWRKKCLSSCSYSRMKNRKAHGKQSLAVCSASGSCRSRLSQAQGTPMQVYMGRAIHLPVHRRIARDFFGARSLISRGDQSDSISLPDTLLSVATT